MRHSEIIKQKALELYTEFFAVYGPYTRKEDGRKILVFYDGTKRSARQYAKIKLEIKLGRKLNKNEEVDHIDGDVENDKFSNLQILTGTENRSKSAKKYTEKDFVGECVLCNVTFKKKSISQKFCSRKCNSTFQAKKKNGIFGINAGRVAQRQRQES